RRGHDTLCYGPLKPRGLTDPRTGKEPYAVVQLRRDNSEGSVYNLVGFQTHLRFPEQRRVFSMIPALHDAEFLRYGVMHRNTFLDSPRVMTPALCLKEHPNVFFAGQITGFEGYMESAACGLLAARAIYDRLTGGEYAAPPRDTMCGALVDYITTENKNFQPMGANMGILPVLEKRPRDKRLRYMAAAERAVESFKGWLAARGETIPAEYLPPVREQETEEQA
ncbi:MAG: methylenetetrahydrofolate--tRNA-(uracil(54)-C(5))-methyltransferase (FADH(2)-oxidizing) TrmFO, partial [Faecalibacterium sp.]|nr:methylenetetrahydrofolate--tRNA-(uracil(54)-C(5))-methyltransferase (FADH(2)-oxidizing) TrmFO [Faecalibacterium sp.]